MNAIHIKSILPEQLDDFVHNKAEPGDIVTSYDSVRGIRYWYFCTKDNVCKGITPFWESNSSLHRVMLENQFKDMSLEQKIDFLVNDYIENEVMKLKEL